LKLVTGNPGKRKLPTHEPRPRGNLAAAPDWLSDDQKTGWRYALDNAPLGLIKLLDRGAFTVWVVAEDLHRQASVKVSETGLLVGAPVGSAIQNPHLPIVNRQALIMLKAASELGFTPAARPRLACGEPARAEGEAETFFD